MNPTTPLLRQIHPSFMADDGPGSQAFRPTPKDQGRLSVEDGDRIEAEAAWRRFTEGGLKSAGVLGVQVGECEAEGLPVIADGVPHEEHVSIDFSAKSNAERKTISKRLRYHAISRGWLYRQS